MKNKDYNQLTYVFENVNADKIIEIFLTIYKSSMEYAENNTNINFDYDYDFVDNEDIITITINGENANDIDISFNIN